MGSSLRTRSNNFPNTIVYIVAGRNAQAKLTALKNQAIPAKMLKERFQQADTTNSGQLDMASFKTLALTLGLNLNRREVETAFMMLDKDGSGKIGYPEFETWWNTVEQPSPFPHLV
jgi:Ca2+-binding EF-hand superfamily protein